MNTYAVPPLFGSLAFSFLAYFVSRNKPRTKIKVLFSILCLETFWWQICWFVSFFAKDPAYISLIAKVAYITITFLPFTFYHFILTFLKKEQEVRKEIYFFYGIGTFLVLLLFPTSLYVKGHRSFPWGYFAAAGPLYPLFMVTAISALLRGIFRLWSSIRNPAGHGVQANQGKYLLLGMFFYALCASDFAQVYGASWYPLGTIFFLGSFLTITYAVTRHHVLDIDVFIKRTAVFAGLFAATYGSVCAFILLGQRLFERWLGWNQWVGGASTIFFVLLIYDPLRKFLINMTEKFLFQKKHDPAKILKSFSRRMLTELELDKIVASTKEIIDSTIHPESFSIYLWDVVKGCYLSQVDGQEDYSFGLDSKLVEMLHKSGEFVLVEGDRPTNNKKKNHVDLSGVKGELTPLKMVLALPLKHQENLLGFMLLGKKKSDEEYSEVDLEVLTDLALEETIAIQNSKTTEVLAQAKAIETLAFLTDTLSHQFNNRFGTVQSVLEAPKEIVPDMLKETENLKPEEKAKGLEKIVKFLYEAVAEAWKNAYIGGLIAKTVLLFTRPEKVAHDMIYFPVGIQMAYVMSDKNKRDFSTINQKEDIGPDIPKIWSNVAVPEQIFENCFNNSFDAIKKRKETKGQDPDLKGEIMVVFRYQQATNAIRIEIRDNGCGMTKDELRRLNAGTPNFTTKGSSGQETGYGSGTKFLTLLIMRKLGGTIRYESKPNEGTTCIIELPVRGKPEEKMKRDAS